MIQISNVIDAVEQMAPSQTQESWDNSGVKWEMLTRFVRGLF